MNTTVFSQFALVSSSTTWLLCSSDSPKLVPSVLTDANADAEWHNWHEWSLDWYPAPVFSSCWFSFFFRWALWLVSWSLALFKWACRDAITAGMDPQRVPQRRSEAAGYRAAAVDTKPVRPSSEKSALFPKSEFFSSSPNGWVLLRSLLLVLSRFTMRLPY